ncbi:MAG: Sua5/YciO/YrdC/YwlC family protein [Chromatiales bacterium]|nr:Sua5/YciO/YrdC/YwlC family protein [Chromatiales bacterium]
MLRLLRLKRRSVRKGLIVLAAETVQILPYVESIPAPVLASWPGPHTWLLRRACRGAGLDHRRAGEGRGARVTAHPQAAALCRAAGMAIISTSANRGGEAPARTDREVRRRFGRFIDYVLPGRVGEAPAPTPIRDAETGGWCVLDNFAENAEAQRTQRDFD